MSTQRTRSLILERAHLAWDLAIIVLVVINLGLLLFDSLYLLPPLNAAFEGIAPSLHAAYDRYIHANFFTIDLAFVTVFLLDVLLGWAVAIAERRYHRWFFYPFVHWYDVLGCIPLGGFRLLRVLRVISLLHRLQRLGLIDVRRWYVYSVVAKYVDILMEELTDRIAIRLLDNVQRELTSGEGLASPAIDKIITPRKEALVQEISQRLENMVGDIAYRNRFETLAYVRGLVARTLAETPELQRLKRLPMGSQLTQGLETSLSDLACHIVDEALAGLRSPQFSTLVEHMAESGLDAWLRTDPETEQITEQVLVDMLELLKDRIAIKRWQERYE
ncbi:ion transporter [Halomonas litopenaei]|uniref:ion transporter n=1 Tax=Halomonas litopenaei TaxID=2109328 RepID=UPI001A8C8CD3|nr:ion transporter [Halomonas litopenaei]MBN8411132.1 ion transporter [Halomonas litopenaei]